MIDSSIDSDFAALERQESLKETPSVMMGRESGDGAVVKVHRGRMAMLSVRGTREAEETSVGVPPPVESAGLDPLAHLQTARLGFAAAVVLVLCWLWIRQRRKAF